MKDLVGIEGCLGTYLRAQLIEQRIYFDVHEKMEVLFIHY